MPRRDAKSTSQQRFGDYAHNYVHSEVHATGADLTRLVALADPQSDWVALDVATGGGHTALHIAPRAARVIAADISARMLAAARAHIAEKKIGGVEYTATDAENIAFATDSFDLVTCRIAPHHFPDAFRFVQEVARVLKPGGIAVVQDHLLPDDARAARYLDAFERLRDPSHHRAFAEYEWRGMCLDAGLTVEHTETLIRAEKFVPWVERQGCSPYTVERLTVMLAQAPDAVAAWLQPRCAGTPDAAFVHRHILIRARRPV